MKKASIYITIFIVLVAFIWLKSLPFSHQVKSNSMSPSLTKNVYFRVNPFTYFFNDPKRFDIVVFKPNEKHIRDPEIRKNFGHLALRVIGLPNEHLVFKGNYLYINDKRIDIDFKSSIKLHNNNLRLGSDEFYLVGDNTHKALDSRVFGPLKKSLIVGKLIQI